MTKRARNARYTKEYNRKNFIRLLRQEPMSSASVARRMGLTRAAASIIADQLLTEGVIVKEKSTLHQRGRTPILLALKPDYAYSIGVWLHRNSCTVGLIDVVGQVLAQKQVRMDAAKQNNKINALTRIIKKIIKDSGIDEKRIIGVGISAPGPLDREMGRILNPPKFEMWHQTDIAPSLFKALGIPVYLENDASCLAQYNLAKPEAGGSENFLLLLVDNGVGSGIISHGKLLKGAGYFTAELGHTSINYRGKKCVCGNTGCLEAYAGIYNLLDGTAFTSWKEIMDAYPTNPAAKAILQREADYLSTGIVNLANVISIDTVLLAGEMLYKANELIPFLEKNVMSKLLRRDILPLRILPAFSGANYQLLAAADIVFERFLMM